MYKSRRRFVFFLIKKGETVPQVLTAQPYNPSEMGSFGKASYMLIRQFQFPDTYADDEIMISADHDRCFQWDWEHARTCCEQYLKTGEGAIGDWVRRASEEAVLSFLKDILKADKVNPGTIWTGFRVLGTVNRSSGYPVFSLQLFAKRSGSTTRVYSDHSAPNISVKMKWAY